MKSAVERIKEILAQAAPPPALLIAAFDTVRTDRITRLLQDKFFATSAHGETTRYRCADLSASKIMQIRDSTRTGSLFAAKRLVIIDGVQDAKGETLKAITSLTEEFLQSPTPNLTILLRLASETVPDGLGKLLKTKELATVLPELKGEELERWTAKELRQQGLEQFPPTLITHIIACAEERADEVAKIVERLALYCDGNSPTLDDLSALFRERIAADEFKLLDLITARKADAAWLLLGRLLETGLSPFVLFALLARNFSTYLAVHALAAQRLSADAIARDLKIAPWLARKHLTAVKNFSEQDLSHALATLAHAEIRLKGRSLGTTAVMSSLVDSLANRRQHA